ncbi:prepilin-type N-terminal cleavage/methylation domain-containing protein [Clostridium sp. D2Q-11]|uniref:Prepilin-type N-terminal cleavage/methylation domain-containing protein n=1 Tax=Anaeromonas frigoriresistens TaxID=2683708 RepID=A0A942Z8P2_9FIRM|nr:prepilin-type N-terminal cleavage/methylation domain-containing protein [Anaeromonas frigoriresistens]MBS4540007.1 prepilin-type N-terminal cleavage/methylation domain-containing protein [Anaeromonas frigoriresistens]
MKKTIYNNKGFTLLELIITLAILSIIIIPISSLFIGSAKATNASNDKMVASYIAQREMEKVKSTEEITVTTDEKEIDDTEHNGFSYAVEISEVEGYLREEEGYINEIPNNVELDMDEYSNYSLEVNTGGSYTLTGYSNGTFQIDNNEIILLLNISGEDKGTLTVSIDSPISLKIYIKKEQDITIENKLGNIQVYRNFSDNSELKSGSKIYEVIIKVYKDSNLLKEFKGYKNMV